MERQRHTSHLRPCHIEAENSFFLRNVYLQIECMTHWSPLRPRLVTFYAVTVALPPSDPPITLRALACSRNYRAPLTAFPSRVIGSPTVSCSSAACDLKIHQQAMQTESEVVSIKGSSSSLLVFLLSIPPTKHHFITSITAKIHSTSAK